MVTVNTAQSILNLNNSGRIHIDAASLNLGSGGASNNAGGAINVANGAALNQLGHAITGGTINTTGTGKLVANNSNGNFLNGVTFNGMLDMASGTMVERVTGGLTLNGSISINNNSVMSFIGDQTLSGSGTIVLGDTGGSNRALGMQGDTVLTVGQNIVVRGQNGTLGQAYLAGGNQSLVNNGRISADVAGGSISLAPGNGSTNNGVIEAKNSGTLVLNSNVAGIAAGSIVAGAGSAVIQNGVTLSGVINTSGNGNFLSGVSFNGVLDLASGTMVERVTGGLTLNGTVTINNNSVLSFAGDQTLGGTGAIVLGDTGASNRALSMEGNTVLTLGAGVVLRGHSGTLGQAYLAGGTQNIINTGGIISDGGRTLIVTPTNMINHGLMRAQNGTLTIQSPLSGTGTLQADATGIVNLANGAKTQGQLLMGAAGAALNLGTGNLTINGDYTNAGAGTGNAFNRRAGVSGVGQIVPGGNAAQAITGASVSNGNTNNATLTLGNLRVGANTVNYQVANTGATGPTLRGAIQTSVNGANLTDARLSGSGVTPSLYSAGAPGANGGNLAVVFTAANAGALAPLVGQVLNLRSNFDNIADQKLNIVLAGNAAAYNAAVGAATPTPVLLANQRVGGSGSVQLNVSNTAAAGAFSEDLRATFGANTGAATHNGGSISALLAGASNAGAMAVGLNTATAGAKAGTVTLNYDTTGTVNGVSNGLALAGANAPQVINVSGNVYQLATGALQTPTLNFGTLQVGQTVSQSLVVRNTAIGAAGFVEDLKVAFGASGNGQITGIGVLNGILAGANSSAANGAMSVSVTGAAAGALISSIAVNYVSAGAVGGVGNGLGVFAVGSENYGVNGLIQAGANVVINQASPLLISTTRASI